jgi:hypothetical protein
MVLFGRRHQYKDCGFSVLSICTYFCTIILEMKKLKLPWLEKDKPTNVVVYKKQKNSNTYYMIVTDIHVDVINNARATKPIVDHKYEIVELGIGFNFISEWSKKYNIKSPKVLAK